MVLLQTGLDDGQATDTQMAVFYCTYRASWGHVVKGLLVVRTSTVPLMGHTSGNQGGNGMNREIGVTERMARE